MDAEPKGRWRNLPCRTHPNVKAKKCRACLPPDAAQREADRRAKDAADQAAFAAFPEPERTARIIDARRRQQDSAARLAALMMVATPPPGRLR